MIRLATPDDAAAITGLIYDLAEYEKARRECTVTEAQITTALFGENPSTFCHVAQEAGAVVGMALWFRNFST